MVKDPVCGMDVNEKTAKLKVEYNGKKYYFCDESCKKEFEKNPGKYVKAGKKTQHGC
jgi:YHS domain-containing protein